MAKRRISKQAVRQSAKKQQEIKQQQRKSLIRLIVGLVGIVAVAVLLVTLLRTQSDDDSPPSADLDSRELDDTTPSADLDPGELDDTTPSADLDPGELDDSTLLADLDDSTPLADPDPSDLDNSRSLADLDPAERNGYYSEYPAMLIDVDKEYEAVIHTERGDIRLLLYPEEAPLAVNNFVYLAREGFYDGTRFHRVIEDFMAQGGDPLGNSQGGPGYRFDNETDNALLFDSPGVLAMANGGPDTNGSQFFITFQAVPNLNGGYTIFGELLEGEDVLASLTRIEPGPNVPSPSGDVIERVDIIER